MARNKKSRKRRSGQYSRFRAPRSADEFFALPEQFQTDWKKSLDVISKMRTKGISLREASRDKDIAINPRTVTRLARRALKERSNGSYAVTKTDSLLRVMMIPTRERMREISLRNSGQASTLAKYSDAVQKYMRTGDASELKKFKRKTLKDASGVKIPLITEQTELDRLGSAGVLSFEQIYARST